MKTSFLLLGVFLAFAANAQTDKEGCRDHALIPSRIPGYYIDECEQNDFSSHMVPTPLGERTIEGKKTVLQYVPKQGAKPVSETFVRRNYVEALKKQKGKVVYESSGRGVVVVTTPDRSEVWVDVTGYAGDGTPEETGRYYVVVVEIAAMEQVITAADMSRELENTGRSVLYIQFETGKSTIRPESAKIIERMAQVLNTDRTLKVYIVGHTDNVGTLEANMKLSDDRANAVVAMLTTQYTIPAERLVAKGVGPLSPVANNRSEDGRKLNRRVEMVRQ